VERAVAWQARPAPRRGGQLIRVTFGVAAALSVAAAIVLVIQRPERAAMDEASVAEVAPLAPVRSTQPLFHEPFARAGGASDRIDRIAMARSSDLRDNRFALWGVR
jgi:hypothetical protein